MRFPLGDRCGRSDRSLRILAGLSILLCGVASALPGQLPAAGGVADSMVSPRDPHQRYALFLPHQYNSNRRWPLFVAMDPRGRALRILHLLQPMADRYGYLIISSYNTRSDELTDPNAAAVNAMLADADKMLAIDSHRIYFVGFSGTARAAWEYGYALRGQVAGVLGFGAGFPPGWLPPDPPAPTGPEAPFVFFGGAGATDFNHEEMEELGPRLDSLRLHHRIVFYDGPHSWGPADVIADGVTWVELQAQRRGLAPRVTGWIDSLFTARMASAAAADSAGQTLLALERYRDLAADFAGLQDVATAERRARALASSRPGKEALARRRKRLDRYHEYIDRLREVLGDWRSSRLPRLSSKLIDQLAIPQLQREAADRSDPERALASARLLEEVFALSSFYQPRAAIIAGAPDRALVLLDLAEFIHPGREEVCRSRNDALGRLGRLDTRECGPTP